MRDYLIVEVDAVIVPDGRRPVRDVSGLAESIKEIGLINPIMVTNSYVLVSGLHRLTACKSLGMSEIPAIVVEMSDIDLELTEIDENLIRNELTALEHAECVGRRKELYEAKHPETRRGGDRRSESVKNQTETISVRSFAEDTAKKTGLTDRTVRHESQIANAIPKDVRDAVRDTPIAKSKTELLALAKEKDPVKQRAIVESVKSGKSETVRQAIAENEPKPAPATSRELTRVALVAVKALTQDEAAILVMATISRLDDAGLANVEAQIQTVRKDRAAAQARSQIQ